MSEDKQRMAGFFLSLHRLILAENDRKVGMKCNTTSPSKFSSLGNEKPNAKSDLECNNSF